MRKENINWLVDLYIKLRPKKTLNSLLGISILLLAREGGSQIKVAEIIVTLIKNSAFFAEREKLSATAKIIARLIFVEGNSISLAVFSLIFLILALLKGIEIVSSNSKKVQEREKEIEKQAETKIDRRIKAYVQAQERRDRKKDAQINLINNLINKGLIEEEDVYDHIESGDLYAVYISPVPLPITSYPKNRLYPEFLTKDLRFVRMGLRSTLFITNSKRLPKNLRDTRELKEYLLKKFDGLLRREWSEFMAWLKVQTADELVEAYKLLKSRNYKNVLGLSVTIIRGKVNENNLGFLHGNILTPKFKDMLNEEVDLKKIGIRASKKVAVKRFVLASSFELLFQAETRANLAKLKSLESKLKKNLEIENFTEYQYRSKEDIVRVLEEEFDHEMAEKYADILVKGSSKYEKALKALGISI